MVMATAARQAMARRHASSVGDRSCMGALSWQNSGGVTFERTPQAAVGECAHRRVFTLWRLSQLVPSASPALPQRPPPPRRTPTTRARARHGDGGQRAQARSGHCGGDARLGLLVSK